MPYQVDLQQVLTPGPFAKVKSEGALENVELLLEMGVVSPEQAAAMKNKVKSKIAATPNIVPSFDIAHPPTKFFEHQEYPKMLYQHPKNRTMEDVTLIVKDPDEEKQAFRNGFDTKSHKREPVCGDTNVVGDREYVCEWHRGHTEEGRKHQCGRIVWGEELTTITATKESAPADIPRGRR